MTSSPTSTVTSWRGPKVVTATHLPVMSATVVEYLAPGLSSPGAVLLDATLGLGGHAAACLERFPDLVVVGIDRDRQALELAADRLAGWGDRLKTFHGRYDELGQALAAAGLTDVSAGLFDLGLSSLQIDDRQRGFAYAADTPLDMRMDADAATMTAADIVNTYSAEDLARVFRRYGDEPAARRVAAAIVAQRAVAPFTRSSRLVDTIVSAQPAHRSGGHPAKRVFQALRIEVNAERDGLAAALPAALAALRLGGRLAVLSYHSGEDRLVKQVFAQATTDQVPPGMPIVPVGRQARFRAITRGAERPQADEIMANPRSQSARLRVVERIEVDG